MSPTWMMQPRTVRIICAKAPRRIEKVPAVRVRDEWRCSWCHARVKVAW